MQKTKTRKKILAYADASGSVPFALAGSMIGVQPLAAAAADNHDEVTTFGRVIPNEPSPQTDLFWYNMSVRTCHDKPG